MKILFRAALLAILGWATFATPAASQLGSIFGEPPRPPANVPSRAPAPPPLGLPQQMPPEEMDEDAPPATTRMPRTAPQSLLPGTIRSQPLPPPPGSAPVAAPSSSPGVPPGAPGQAIPPIGEIAPSPRQTRPPQPANTAPQPGDEVITEMPSQKIANPTAVFAGLDKITGRIIAFDVALNETVQFGALQVTPHACYTRPSTEAANTDAFVDVDEVTLQGEVKRLFAGWMFASSPGMHAVEHPIYDVWLTDCKGGASIVADTQPGMAPPARAQRLAKPPQSLPPPGAPSGSSPPRH